MAETAAGCGQGPRRGPLIGNVEASTDRFSPVSCRKTWVVKNALVPTLLLRSLELCPHTAPAVVLTLVMDMRMCPPRFVQADSKSPYCLGVGISDNLYKPQVVKMPQLCGRQGILLILLTIFAITLFVQRAQAQVPVFEIIPAHSSIKFHVKSSVTLAGKFDKWDASLTFTSPDERTGVLEVKIEAASVDTGSGLKNGKLKSKDFFDVEQNPYITFKSTKVVPIGKHTYEVDGDFTIRGISNPEKLTLTVSGTGSGDIHGAMVFNRKDYGMDKGIPFIKIADHVDVNIHLKWKHTAGPPLA